jgi:hypothetical protein
LTFNNLNENFPNGCYAIAYVHGYGAAVNTLITDGTTSNYFATGTVADLVEITDTDPSDGASVGNYAIFGSTNSALTANSITFTCTPSVGGAGIGGVQLIAVGGGSAYDEWADSYGITADGPLGDSDFEGTKNIIEFALGGNPTNALDNGYAYTSTAVDGGTNWFEYVYARSTNPQSGITYTPETGTDLISTNWTNSGYTEMAPTSDLGNGYEAVTLRVPTSNPKTFVRLLIEQNQ